MQYTLLQLFPYAQNLHSIAKRCRTGVQHPHTQCTAVVSQAVTAKAKRSIAPVLRKQSKKLQASDSH